MYHRLLIPEDIPACLQIFESNIPEYFDPSEKEEFLDWLKKEDRDAYYVIENNDNIIGCGGIYYDKSKNETGLAWGMVLKNLHGKGFGTYLTQIRIDLILKSYPKRKCIVSTSQHTSPFYEKFGFEIISREKNGFGIGIDKIIMNLPSKA